MTVSLPQQTDDIEHPDDTIELFERYTSTRSRATRNELVSRHLELAERCARRYRHRGEPLDDLVQVASFGLVKAVERFDPARGSFPAFAIPTIMGELKRHFRDATWSVAVPRRPKELRSRVSASSERLQHDLGRAPTVDEVADHSGIPREHVIEALEAEHAYRPLPLDSPSRTFDAASAGDGDVRDTALFVRGLLDGLDERDRHIVFLTYFSGWTQREIGERLGLGQVQVSRRLSAVLERLRVEADRPTAA